MLQQSNLILQKKTRYSSLKTNNNKKSIQNQSSTTSRSTKFFWMNNHEHFRSCADDTFLKIRFVTNKKMRFYAHIYSKRKERVRCVENNGSCKLFKQTKRIVCAVQLLSVHFVPHAGAERWFNKATNTKKNWLCCKVTVLCYFGWFTIYSNYYCHI